MILSSRNKIRLSRHLHAQTTPYPRAGRWLKTGIAGAAVLLVAGIYAVARPQTSKQSQAGPREILGEQAKPMNMETYTVKRGDTLFNVSQQYGISWQTLAKLNNLESPYILRGGQKLKIPSK